MVQIANWDAFYAAAEKMRKEGLKDTRMSTKYRHKDGKLVVKVTNDETCITYKTIHASDIHNIEKLQSLFLGL